MALKYKKYKKRTFVLSGFLKKRKSLFSWIRRESNPRPKAHSMYFYDHILFLRTSPFPASGERTVNLAGLVASSYAHDRKA